MDYSWHLCKPLQLFGMMNHFRTDWFLHQSLFHIPSHIIARYTIIHYQAVAIKGVKRAQPYIFTNQTSCCEWETCSLKSVRTRVECTAAGPCSTYATGDCEILITARVIFQSLQLIKWRPIMIPFAILAVLSHGFRGCFMPFIEIGRWKHKHRKEVVVPLLLQRHQDKSPGIDCAPHVLVINWLDGRRTTKGSSAVIDSLIFFAHFFPCSFILDSHVCKTYMWGETSHLLASSTV